MRSTRSILLFLVAAVTMAAIVAGLGASSSDAVSATPTAGRHAAYHDRVRDAVVRGAGVDFAIGTGIGGPSSEACVKGLLREALNRATIDHLRAIYRRPGGVAHAAQALNRLVAPVADHCGNRSWVPELIEAAGALRSGRPIGVALAKLGVTYGPFLGKRCRHVVYPSCERIGIDVVFGHATSRVVAIAGDQRIRLRTPGKHNGIPHHDWVGTFTQTGLADAHGSANRSGELLYAPVELRVTFTTGRRARALFPHVLVTSGWG
jgi:hypothetical protein